MGPRSNAVPKHEPGIELSGWSREQHTPAANTSTNPLPLTAALIDLSLHAVSFATPGHRGGRSWFSRLER